MPPADSDRTRSRFIHAVSRFLTGARLQQQRLEERTRTAPRLLEGTEYEVVNLTGLPDNDLDYYTYEVARLQDAARTVIAVFENPAEVVDALAAFEAAIPQLRAARNPQTHVSDDDRLDDFAWLGALVRLGDDGSVEYLIDPRYEHHAAVEALVESLLAYLRQGLRTSP